MRADPRTDVEHRLQSLLDERLEGISQRIQEWLEDAQARAGSLTEIVEAARREPVKVTPEAIGEQAPAGDEVLSDLKLFAQEIEGSADQVAILGRLVNDAADLASRVVLFVVRNEGLCGWAARGFGQDFNPRRITIPAAPDTWLGRAHDGCAPIIARSAGSRGDLDLLEHLGGDEPVELLAAPLWVRDRVAAILYADTRSTEETWCPDAIQLMVSLVALSLEAIPARTKYPRPATGTGAQAVQAESAAPTAPMRADRAAATAATAPPVSGETPVTAETTVEDEETLDPEEVRLHEEARRFARLLVSEILLYNEKEIEEGRRNKDLYERMKEDIDRSRQMYLNRTASRLPDGPDYFHQELLQTLADGDESALNLPWD